MEPRMLSLCVKNCGKIESKTGKQQNPWRWAVSLIPHCYMASVSVRHQRMVLTVLKFISYESTRFCRTTPAGSVKFLWEGLQGSKLPKKIVADWMFIRLGYTLVSLLPTGTVWHPTRKPCFLLFLKVFGNLQTGLRLIPARMYDGIGRKGLDFRIPFLEKTCDVVLAHPKYTKPQRETRLTDKEAK